MDMWNEMIQVLTCRYDLNVYHWTRCWVNAKHTHKQINSTTTDTFKDTGLPKNVCEPLNHENEG